MFMAQKNLEISALYDIYGSLLPEKQQLALDYYYNEDLSLSEIAEPDGNTRQSVYAVVKKVKEKLAKFSLTL